MTRAGPQQPAVQRIALLDHRQHGVGGHVAALLRHHRLVPLRVERLAGRIDDLDAGLVEGAVAARSSVAWAPSSSAGPGFAAPGLDAGLQGIARPSPAPGRSARWRTCGHCRSRARCACGNCRAPRPPACSCSSSPAPWPRAAARASATPPSRAAVSWRRTLLASPLAGWSHSLGNALEDWRVNPRSKRSSWGLFARVQGRAEQFCGHIDDRDDPLVGHPGRSDDARAPRPPGCPAM